MGDDLVVQLGRRVDDLQAAIHEAQRPDGRVDTLGLRSVGRLVLEGEGAVGRHPVLGIVRLLERVAHASVASGEDTGAILTGARLAEGRRVEIEVHQLVHVAQHEHVGVELDDARVLGQREGRQLAPAVVEARVVGVVAALGGQQIRDVLRGDAAGAQGGVAFFGERVGVEGDQRVA